MVRLIIFVCLIWLLVRIVKKIITPASSKETFRNFSNKRNNGSIEEMVQDPCCGKYIPANKAMRIDINGKEFFFCSTQCADRYKNHKFDF